MGTGVSYLIWTYPINYKEKENKKSRDKGGRYRLVKKVQKKKRRPHHTEGIKRRKKSKRKRRRDENTINYKEKENKKSRNKGERLSEVKGGTASHETVGIKERGYRKSKWDRRRWNSRDKGGTYRLVKKVQKKKRGPKRRKKSKRKRKGDENTINYKSKGRLPDVPICVNIMVLNRL